MWLWYGGLLLYRCSVYIVRKNYHNERAIQLCQLPAIYERHSRLWRCDIICQLPAIYERHSRLWRCDIMFPRIFHSVHVVICGICELEQRKCLCIWRASVCWLEVVAVCEFECSRHNRNKGNVLYFGKSQQGFQVVG